MYRSMTNLFAYLRDKYDHADAPVYYALVEAHSDSVEAAYQVSTSPELRELSDRLIKEVIAEEAVESY